MKTITNELDLIKKTLSIHLSVTKKDLQPFAIKLTKNPNNTEEYYQSYLLRKNKNW